MILSLTPVSFSLVLSHFKNVFLKGEQDIISV